MPYRRIRQTYTVALSLSSANRGFVGRIHLYIHAYGLRRYGG